MSWHEQEENERRRWFDEAWWMRLDSDPKYLEWLRQQSANFAVNEQERTNVDSSQEQGRD